MTPRAMLLLQRARRARGDGAPAAPAWRVRSGTIADYRALARFHYRAGDPPGGSRVWVLRDRAAPGEVAGVLVVSRPVLNGPWREAAWPGRYRSGCRRRDACRLNREVRVISRVVIDPRWRATGAGTRLVRLYLRRPLTRRTEAIASMGAMCPLFDRAGMRRVDTRPSRAARRLAGVLARLGVPPWRLACPGALPGSVRRCRRLARALRTWAADGRATAAIAGAPISRLMVAAARALHTPVAYVHDAPEERASVPAPVPATPSRGSP